MPSRYLFAGLGNIVIQPCQTGSGREYSIPVLPACHGLQFTAQGIAQCYVVFHIFCTFASQSRAFLSQLSVTGDESGFFYVLLQRYADFSEQRYHFRKQLPEALPDGDGNVGWLFFEATVQALGSCF